MRRGYSFYSYFGPKRVLQLAFLFFLCLSSTVIAEDITGFWQTINKKTNRPSSVVAVYSYEGKYYGRIIATYDKQGKIDDSIYHPKGRAPGIIGNPYYSGLDIVWNVEPKRDSRKYKGYVVDPKEGKIYDAEIWKDKDKLVLRGEVFIFGKSVTWPPFPESGFNEEFKKPDLTTFVPVIPQIFN
jgi:uncharacterized protein (DUF2147 family)